MTYLSLAEAKLRLPKQFTASAEIGDAELTELLNEIDEIINGFLGIDTNETSTKSLNRIRPVASQLLLSALRRSTTPDEIIGARSLAIVVGLSKEQEHRLRPIRDISILDAVERTNEINE